MQVKPKEVSADKATTPGQRERFEAAYVAEYNQLRNAKYTAEHIARMRVGEGYGERAFLNGWWKGWQAAEAQQAPQWSHAKPTVPGAYWVRGFRIGEPDSPPALVEVARNDVGTLVCNMNDSNTNDQLCEWSFVEDLAERFEWCGPLGLGAPVKKVLSVPIGIGRIEEQMPEGFGECAAIWNCDGNYWKAAIYVWDASFNDSTAVAKWFQNLGAKDVTIAHTLYSTGNGDRDGEVPEGGAREWLVEFSVKEVPHA